MGSGLAYAQESEEISCKGAPPGAVVKLPAPLDRWGEIHCTIYGHTLGAKEGWLWSYPGAFSPVHFPAQIRNDNPQKVGHGAYFKAIGLTKLSEADKARAEEKIDNLLGAAQMAIVGSAYRLVLTNNEGNTHRVVFVMTDEEAENGGFWGLRCSNPACDTGAAFMLLNFEKRQ